MNAPDRGPWLLTQSATKFYVLDPRTEDIQITDIAAGLCRTTRFNGQLKEELEDEIYSVAQHSVYVERLVRMMGHEEATFWGLMHDAAEGFYGDQISPVKEANPLFVEIENRGAAVIREKYSIPYSHDVIETVKWADRALAIMESNAITVMPAVMWDSSTKVGITIEDLDPEFHCWGPKKARDEFLAAFGRHREIA